MSVLKMFELLFLIESSLIKTVIAVEKLTLKQIMIMKGNIFTEMWYEERNLLTAPQYFLKSFIIKVMKGEIYSTVGVKFSQKL